jgi:hypothetical protein
MKEEMSIVPLDAFKHTFSFISLPLASNGATRIGVHATALFNRGESITPGEARRRAQELGGTRYMGKILEPEMNYATGNDREIASEYYAFRYNSRFALRLDILELRKKYKIKQMKEILYGTR